MPIERPKFLYLITDGGELRTKGLLVDGLKNIIERYSNNIWAIQIREQKQVPKASDNEVEEIINSLRVLCEQHNIYLGLNTNLELTLKLNLTFFHAGSDNDLFFKAKTKMPSNSIIGFSAHSQAELKDIDADYFLYSPIFKPISKSNYNHPLLGLDGLKEGVAMTTKKIFALGGVTQDNIKSCLEVGAFGVAGISLFRELTK